MILYGVLFLVGLVAAGEQKWDHHDAHKDCGVKGVGPGYEKSHLDYAGHFKGGARKFLPIYKKVHGEEKEVVVKGGCGAHDHPEHEHHEKEERHKRGVVEHHDDHHDCKWKGVGPGYEKSHLDYAGHFKGGARKFLPIYKKVHGEEKEVVVKGGCGAHDHPEHEHHEKQERHKRGVVEHHDDHHDCKWNGVGPGYEKSHLDYAGKFKGGARKFLPIYKKVHGEEKEVVVKGGCGAHDHKEPEHHEKGERHKRGAVGGHVDHNDCKVKGVGPGYEKSHLDYAGKFKGGARKFLPIYQKEVSEEREVVVKGGCGARDHKEPEHHEKEERHKRGVVVVSHDDHHDCKCKGVGPGYEKSHLDYAGHFKGGARKFLPIYKKVHGEEKEVLVKGGCGAHEHKPWHHHVHHAPHYEWEEKHEERH
ncbi:hypothetical protein TTRE_0000701701 [Trichuris trichiura]|uniref:Histidine-rich glycoprotein-like n=1 Tax=Trichuris trichiura TaxID=36087 RepID=A0A077ZE95_TRITR|nr:hypothetical protein TTRE_0000701701 [Trichuris trichiura]